MIFHRIRHGRHSSDTNTLYLVIFNDAREPELSSHSFTLPADLVYLYCVHNTYKLSFMSAFHDARLCSMGHAQSDTTWWDVDVTGLGVPLRDVTGTGEDDEQYMFYWS